jgi:hypothetical protein
MIVATPKCPHCKGTSFELATPGIGGVRNCQQNVLFVVCAGCKAPAAVLSEQDAGALGLENGRRLTALISAVESMGGTIHQLKTELFNLSQEVNRKL